MTECVRCNVCETPGEFAGAREIGRVRCNVRAFKDAIFTFWRCSSCGSLHCREDADLDMYYRNYPVKVHALDFWARAAYANLLERLRRAGLRRSMSVLDFGCGPGLLVRFLAERGYASVNGYDAHVAQFSDTKILDRTYDCIISQDVIEHFDNPREFLANLVRLLSPGGMLAIGTPDGAEIDLGDPERFSLSLHPPYHRHLLSAQALLAMASQLGLEPVAQYRRFYYDTLWPTVNYRFLRGYVRRAGNVLDAAFEPPHIWLVLTSPVLWFHALFGYFFPPRSEMMVLFRRKVEDQVVVG